MKHHAIKTIAALALGTLLLAGCGKDNGSIVGEWQWTETTMHHVNSYMGQDTTENLNFPIYKDLTFYEDGQVDVLQQGIYFPEDNPLYTIHQYNYSLNAAADTVHLTDPQGEYDSQTWRIKTLTKENLTVEWTRVEGDYAGTDVYTYTTTYRRK